METHITRIASHLRTVSLAHQKRTDISPDDHGPYLIHISTQETRVKVFDLVPGTSGVLEHIIDIIDSIDVLVLARDVCMERLDHVHVLVGSRSLSTAAHVESNVDAGQSSEMAAFFHIDAPFKSMLNGTILSFIVTG